jgi:predicted amidophosphoribosyltransferase
MGILKKAVDLMLPRNCCVCGRFPDADGRIPYDVPDDFHICFDCLSGLIPQPPDRRFFLCLSEQYEGDPHQDLPLYMPFPYKGFFEKAVPSMKFHSHPELAQFAGILCVGLM